MDGSKISTLGPKSGAAASPAAWDREHPSSAGSPLTRRRFLAYGGHRDTKAAPGNSEGKVRSILLLTRIYAMHGSHLILFATLVALAGCSPAPVVTISNRSTNTLTNVVVSGAGFTNRIDSIAAGAERRLTVRPESESGLRIAFDAGSRHVDVDDLAYIETGSGYRVTVTVRPDLKVSASSYARGF